MNERKNEWRWNSDRDWNRSWWFFQLQLGARIALPARRSLELGHNQVSLHLTYTTNRSPFLQSSSRTKCNNFLICKSPPCPAPPHHLTQFTCAQTTVTTNKTWILMVLWGKSWRFWCRLRFPHQKNTNLQNSRATKCTLLPGSTTITGELFNSQLLSSVYPIPTKQPNQTPNSTPAGISKILATCHSVESWASPIPKKSVSGLRRLLQLPPSHLYRKWSWNESRPRLLIG